MTDTTSPATIPTGTVQFYDNTIGIGSPVALDSTGTATLSYSGFATGSTNAITAAYSSDNTSSYANSTSTSPADITGPPQTTVYATTLTLSGPATVQTGQTVTLTATIGSTGGATPTGSVTFRDNGALIAVVQLNSSGVATVPTSGWVSGTNKVTASYSGDATHQGSSGQELDVSAAAPQTAVATSITASVSPNPISSAGSATLTAHVTEVGKTTTPPAGSVVTFRNKSNNSLIAQARLDGNGNASVVKSGWQAGSYTITASYVGDSLDLPSGADISVTVRQPSLVTVTAPSPTITYGDALPSLTPTYSGLTNGDTVSSLTSPATCTTTAATPATVGTSAVTCSGASDTYYTFRYVSGTLTVAKAPLTLTPNSVTVRQGDPLPALTASLSGFVNGETPTTSDVTGSASCTTTAVDSSVLGSYPITCTLGTLASNNYDITVSGQGTLLVIPATLTPTVTTDWVGGPFATGEPVKLYGSLFAGGLPLANQTLTLSLGDTSCVATTDWFGNAKCTVVPTTPLGPTTTKATFAGNGTYASSSDSRNALLYSFPDGGGAFVVGDGSAGDAGTVTFWGAQWSNSNEFSHGDAPNGFKGFASQPGTPTIGASWSTDPGNSSSPPAEIPSYMGVIVTRSVDKSKSSYGGTISNIVIVATNPGYAPDPGHVGTGTIVAALHQLDHPVLTRTIQSDHSSEKDNSTHSSDQSHQWVPRQCSHQGSARAN